MLSEKDRKEIIEIIQLTVNGKIDRLHIKVDAQQESLDTFIKKLDPVIDAMGWLNTTKKMIAWVGGIAGSLAAIFALSNLFQR